MSTLPEDLTLAMFFILGGISNITPWLFKHTMKLSILKQFKCIRLTLLSAQIVTHYETLLFTFF
jgi:hypothetical protein